MSDKGNNWKYYRKVGIQKMRPYIPGENLLDVSVTRGEYPEEGGMIAVDKAGKQWYITPEIFKENYVEVKT